MTHTPEPWRVVANKAIIAGAKGEGEVARASERFMCRTERESNARRIVACVNALPGISTEAIEAGAVQGLVAAAQKLSDAERGYRLCHDVKGDGHIETGRAWDYMRKCGDELRAALSELAEASNA